MCFSDLPTVYRAVPRNHPALTRVCELKNRLGSDRELERGSEMHGGSNGADEEEGDTRVNRGRNVSPVNLWMTAKRVLRRLLGYG